MIVEIEFYKGDILLEGKEINFNEFKRQIVVAEKDYDRVEDNFVALLCQRFQWNVTIKHDMPRFVYDRDIEKVYKVN